jgi:hypothetical protein
MISDFGKDGQLAIKLMSVTWIPKPMQQTTSQRTAFNRLTGHTGQSCSLMRWDPLSISIGNGSIICSRVERETLHQNSSIAAD